MQQKTQSVAIMVSLAGGFLRRRDANRIVTICVASHKVADASVFAKKSPNRHCECHLRHEGRRLVVSMWKNLTRVKRAILFRAKAKKVYLSKVTVLGTLATYHNTLC